MQPGLNGFHVGDDGPSPCDAQERECPVGGKHFSDDKEADRYWQVDVIGGAFSGLSIAKKTQETQKTAASGLLSNERVKQLHFFLSQQLEDARSRGRVLSAKDTWVRHERVEELVGDFVAREKTTDVLYANPQDIANPENQDDDYPYIFNRQIDHKVLISEILHQFKDVPKEGKAIIAGGLGGAGKSTVLRDYAGIDKSQYATINPDDIKEVMAKKGMIPTVDGLTHMEASPLVHEEASFISKEVSRMLTRTRTNVIYDITMSSERSVVERLDQLSRCNYESVEAIFVSINPETSIQRSRNRYREGINDYILGKNEIGGRTLPEHVVINQQSADPNYKSQNELTLIKISEERRFTKKPRIFDNNRNGELPVEIDYNSFSSSFLRRHS